MLGSRLVCNFFPENKMRFDAQCLTNFNKQLILRHKSISYFSYSTAKTKNVEVIFHLIPLGSYFHAILSAQYHVQRASQIQNYKILMYYRK